MKVAIVAEYYPRAADPVLGVWAHRQALAAREAGADVRVVVLHRPVPPLSALRSRDRAAIAAPLRQPAHAELDGIPVHYARFIAPPRPVSYGSWGAWAAPTVALALRRLRREFPFDLVHAHYAMPAGDAVRRARVASRYVVSVHGGDVLTDIHRSGHARRAAELALRNARVVLANSVGTADRCRALGAVDPRVVHLGTDLPEKVRKAPKRPTVVSVGHLVERKRHADLIRAVAKLTPSYPKLRCIIVGDGPERGRLAALARELGVAERVELPGRLPPDEARRRAQKATVFVLPSVDEAFGVAYVEAMAGGVPAIGCRGEAGPEEIAAAGGGIVLVPPADLDALVWEIAVLLEYPERRKELGARARATVERAFTWRRCGEATVEAYEAALR